ncbi:MAG: hypothetical protein RMK29_09420 [Myxococcales bacterium]|nr:hypothetical protein [Myxococcota bacterium]MDW8281919.1 hypothetical protein [Myxococcales bacterium]
MFGIAPIGFAGERKAIALLVLAFYTALYSLMALLMANAPDHPELRAWWPCFASLAGCYGIGFFALGADWFWARWFAIGLGYSGLTLAGWGLFMQRAIEPMLLFYGITHGLVVLVLQGERLKAHFDAKPGWREKFHLDEAAATKVRHTVTRAAASLPTLIMLALAPRDNPAGLALLAVATLGLLGVLRLRTWGILALGSAGLGGLGFVLGAAPPSATQIIPGPLVHAAGLAASAFLLLSVVPFFRPMVRFLAQRR